MAHKHKVKTSRDRAYQGPVALPIAYNQSAHGNITRECTCSCGATQLRNINGIHVEYGPWSDKAT